tara:strand:+ start:189 stop:764 length:576 start_codon:yes stop_codon:yes gene_type:complete
MEKKRLIIALSGKKRSGKDTVADYLVERFGFVKYGFADPIKEIGKIMFDFCEQQLNTNNKEEIDKRWGITPRQFMQRFGTDYGQFVFPKHFPEIFKDINERDFWLKRFDIWYQKQNNLKIVVSDVRFLHEFEHLKKMEAYMFKIKRKDLISKDGHISENELDLLDDDNFNLIINNDSTKEELYEFIDEKIR